MMASATGVREPMVFVQGAQPGEAAFATQRSAVQFPASGQYVLQAPTQRAAVQFSAGGCSAGIAKTQAASNGKMRTAQELKNVSDPPHKTMSEGVNVYVVGDADKLREACLQVLEQNPSKVCYSGPPGNYVSDCLEMRGCYGTIAEIKDDGTALVKPCGWTSNDAQWLLGDIPVVALRKYTGDTHLPVDGEHMLTLEQQGRVVQSPPLENNGKCCWIWHVEHERVYWNADLEGEACTT